MSFMKITDGNSHEEAAQTLAAIAEVVETR
jgi:hypothetical protein